MMPWLGRGYADRSVPGDMDRQTRRFRMWRPWMWGPLRHLWQVRYSDAGAGTFWGPDRYTWRSAIDREIDRDARAAYEQWKKEKETETHERD